MTKTQSHKWLMWRARDVTSQISWLESILSHDPVLFEVLHIAGYIDQLCIVSDVNSLVAIY